MVQLQLSTQLRGSILFCEKVKRVVLRRLRVGTVYLYGTNYLSNNNNNTPCHLVAGKHPKHALVLDDACIYEWAFVQHPIKLPFQWKLCCMIQAKRTTLCNHWVYDGNGCVMVNIGGGTGGTEKEYSFLFVYTMAFVHTMVFVHMMPHMMPT